MLPEMIALTTFVTKAASTFIGIALTAADGRSNPRRRVLSDDGSVVVVEIRDRTTPGSAEPN